MVASFHLRGDVENGFFDAVQMHAGQLDGGALIAGLDVFDQAQVFVIAAHLVAVVIQCSGIQRGARDQLLEPVEQYRIVQAARQFEVELAEQMDQSFMVAGSMPPITSAPNVASRVKASVSR